MLVFALSALIALQEAQPADPATATPQEEPAPAEPADAATLVAQFENRWNDWNELVGQIAARKAREAYAADLIYPVIARTDLETGARSTFMQAAGGQLDRQEQQNTQWAVRQLDPGSFADFHALQPRPARELLRMAMRDEAALATVVAALEPLAQAGEYDGAEFADMADRLAVSESRGQPYGTQTHCVDGEIALQPLADPDALDARRAAIGLDALDRDAAEGAACETAPSEDDG